ncbi:MAG: hypothetical protein CENE_02250 [Candidatus Celerinatantimonas neptuna]|nr:MAG: hypothetical protein CENE_02250 [Candidatus Celerinatantimonas neptuna]
MQHSLNLFDISAIGHLLGGWTVMFLAGAQVDSEVFSHGCHLHPNPRICGVGREMNLMTPVAPRLNQSLRDPRIKRVVSLDLGLAHSFSMQSLAKVRIPVLILGAGVDIGDLPEDKEFGFLARHLPARLTQYIVFENAAHFSFLQLCKPNASVLLN